ncbi:MAG: histidine phosphotransferase family protein [Roseovarius sp.]
MAHPSDKIAALIGSRICHDLINPVGAVSNGLELLQMAGVPRSPELSLLTESAAQATARIRLLRLAFGNAGGGQAVAAAELRDILAATHGTGRLKVDWQADGTHPRGAVKAVLLALLCAETALPAGGRISVARTAGEGWDVHAAGARIAADPALWRILEGAPAPATLPPAAVQFLLLPDACTTAGLGCAVTQGDEELRIALRAP